MFGLNCGHGISITSTAHKATKWTQFVISVILVLVRVLSLKYINVWSKTLSCPTQHNMAHHYEQKHVNLWLQAKQLIFPNLTV